VSNERKATGKTFLGVQRKKNVKKNEAKTNEGAKSKQTRWKHPIKKKGRRNLSAGELMSTTSREVNATRSKKEARETQAKSVSPHTSL